MKFTTNMFSQILQIIPRLSFAELVHKHQAERCAKGFFILGSTGCHAFLSNGSGQEST